MKRELSFYLLLICSVYFGCHVLFYLFSQGGYDLIGLLFGTKLYE
jgi:hypothetical protein